ncbi:MAG TPA: hypothetical protein VMU99_08770 [Acidimicrobiales bacterium]|nr:hypothetical protein [Acidimicrobiales bacterium]
MKRSPLVVGGALFGALGALALYAASGTSQLGTLHVGAPSKTAAPLARTTTAAPATSQRPTTATPNTTAPTQYVSPSISGSEGEGATFGNSGTGNTGVRNGSSQDHPIAGTAPSTDN